MILLGMFGVGNHGNEASLRSAIEQLRRRAPDVRITVACPEPLDVRAEHGVDAMPMQPAAGVLDRLPRAVRLLLRPAVDAGRWLVVLRRILRADVVLVPGTGVFDDFSIHPFSGPYHMFAWALMARLARRPVVFMCVGAGPIEHPTSARFFRAAARLGRSCTYRDEWSRDYMAGIGRDVSNDAVVCDIAFGLTVTPAALPAAPGAAPTIGVGVMPYRGWDGRDPDGTIYERHLERLTRTVSELLARGYEVRLLLGAVEDRGAVADLLERLGTAVEAATVATRVHFDDHDSIAELLGEIAGVDLVVTSRFHNVVAAFLAERPVVSIGYGDKSRALLERVGLDDLHQNVADFDVDRLLGDIDAVLARDDVVARIRAAVDGFHRQLSEQFAALPM